MSDDEGFRERVSGKGEEALGQLLQGLIENPALNQALQGALGARERAVQAQQAAMAALNLPSAADVERLTRRVRSVSQRLEAIEDGVDRVEERLRASSGGQAGEGTEKRLADIEGTLEELVREVSTLRKRIGREEGVSSDQERLRVNE